MRNKYGRKRNNKPTQHTGQDRALEIVRDKLRTYIDKYAKIVGNAVEYSFYDHKTRTATKKEVSLAECVRITEELYS